MVFQPALPLTGYAGWQFLQRTLPQQTENFQNSPEIKRNIEHFRENASKLTSLDALMSDRQLKTVALGAFGLLEDLDKPAFVRKVLAEGTFDEEAFANKLNSKQYRDFANTFGYGNEGVFITDGFIDRIVSLYETREFERAIGEVDNDMRLGLNFSREIQDIVGSSENKRTGWLTAMGSIPIRTVIEKAYNLPPEFAQIDLDQQVDVLMEKTREFFSSDSVDVFADQTNVDDVIRRFQLRQQIEAGPSPTTPGFAALSVLESSGIGSTGILNLLLSNSR